MNLPKLLGLSLLIVSVIETSVLAQTKQNPCPKNSAPEIWIKDKGADKYREGVGRKFVDIQGGELIYCVGNYVAQDKLSGIEEIRFAPPGVAKTNPPTVSQTGSTFSTVIPDETAVVRAYIYSPTNLQHPTLTGRVTLEVVLYENGAIGPIRVIHTDHSVLTNLAEAEAKRLKFTPGIKSGNWVSVIKQVEFTFSQNPTASPISPNPPIRPRSVLLPSFKVLKPDSERLINRDDVILQWESVPDTFGYRIEVQCSYNYNECLTARVAGSQTSYTLKFLGDGPVRWRVFAERKNGKDAVSTWGFFGYKK